jgi:hypothetical protein
MMQSKGLVAQLGVLSTYGGLIWEMSVNNKKESDDEKEYLRL